MCKPRRESNARRAESAAGDARRGEKAARTRRDGVFRVSVDDRDRVRGFRDGTRGDDAGCVLRSVVAADAYDGDFGDDVDGSSGERRAEGSPVV